MQTVSAPAPARNGRRPAARRQPAAPPPQPTQPAASPTPDAAALTLALYPDLLPAYAAADPAGRARFAATAARRAILRLAGGGAVLLADELAAELTNLRNRILAHARRLRAGADAAAVAGWMAGLDPTAADPADPTDPATLAAAGAALSRLAGQMRRAEDVLFGLAAPLGREEETAALLAALTGEGA